MAEAEPAARSLLLVGLLCAGFGSLVSGQQLETLAVPENQPIDIPCKAADSQSSSSRLEWKFQSGGSTALIYYNDKFTPSYVGHADFYPRGIRLKSATRKDNGQYICEIVDSSGNLAVSRVNLIVQVPPSKPKAHVPFSVIIGNKAILTCLETDGSPPPTFKWYKNDVPMPTDPKTSSLFRNSSYTLNPKTGVLTFEPAVASDAGDYYCEAENNVGTPQKSEAVRMETNEVNVGGIVAAVVVLLIVLGLIGFGIWFAYRRGFFSKQRDTTNKKVIYSQPSTRSDGEFKQTSSFLV